MSRFFLNIIIAVVSLFNLFSCDKEEIPSKISSPHLTNVENLSIETTVKFVNADTVSRLPIYYKVLDKNGQRVYFLEDRIELYANGIRQTNNRYISTSQAQIITLEARLASLRSASYTITARPSRTYPLVRLPLIFHVPKNIHLDEAKVNLDEVIKKINKIYRSRRDSLNPNVADSYIEFYLATKGPDGKVLPQSGVNYLTVVSPTIADSARIIAVNVLRNWCPKNYLNVFVDVNFFKGYVPDGYSASFRPELKIYPNNPTCHDLNTQLSSDSAIPAIVLYNEYAFSTLAHELGHFMGLYHTFDTGCSNSPNQLFVNVEDTPRHLESRPSGTNEGFGYKFSCEGIPFYSTNVMDYHVPAISFTQDQVAVMHYFITHPYYLPL